MVCGNVLLRQGIATARGTVGQEKACRRNVGVADASEGTLPSFLKLKVRGEKCTFKTCKTLFAYNNDKCGFLNGFLSGLSHKVDRNIGSKWKVYLLILYSSTFHHSASCQREFQKHFTRKKIAFISAADTFIISKLDDYNALCWATVLKNT